MNTDIRKIDINIDIPESQSGAGRCSIAVSLVFAPEILRNGDADRPRPILFMVPGAGYSRHYYDMCLDGDWSYSQARYHAARGCVVAMMDYAGAGDSKAERADALDFHAIAEIHDHAIATLMATLADGSAHPDVPAIGAGKAIGIGQSLGGVVTTITQARHASCQAIAILGASARETSFPQRPGQPAGSDIDWTYVFHSDATPAEIVAMDMGAGYPVRTHVPEFATNDIPACTAELFTRPDYLSSYAADIAVPLFLGYGSRDTSGDPRKEPSAYGRVDDFSLCIIADMAHMHNFAPTRAQLWKRLQAWIDNLDD